MSGAEFNFKQYSFLSELHIGFLSILYTQIKIYIKISSIFTGFKQNGTIWRIRDNGYFQFPF